MGKMYLNGHLYGGEGATEYAETVLWSNESGQEFWPQSTYTATLSDNMFNYNLLAFTFSTVAEPNFLFTTLVPVSEIDKNGIKSFNSVVIGGNANGAPTCYYVDYTHLAIAGWTSQFHMKIYKIIGIRCGAKQYHYSTTEHVVGTWLDGSMLYERTFVNTSPNRNDWTDICDDSNIDIKGYVSSASWVEISSNEKITLDWYVPVSNTYCRSIITNSNHKFRVDVSGNTPTTIVATLQYTKTTN